MRRPLVLLLALAAPLAVSAPGVVSTPAAVSAPSAVAAQAAVSTPQLGKPVDPSVAGTWDSSIAPDGKGLPAGRGSVSEGAAIYAQKCSMCHGVDGKGQPADPLAGGIGTLASPASVKTVASYWPYATTLFDYIRRAMPVTAPRSLSDHEVYALVAYLLSIDGIVKKNAVMDAKSVPRIKMPNRDGFIDAYSASRR